MKTLRLVLTRTVEYDAIRRRLWILNQRCHHGATGVMLAGGALVCAGVGRLAVRDGAALAGAGTLLMAHDWQDRAMWFQRGPGCQP